MLAFFRRIINSRVGVVVTLGVLVLIALAFVIGDVTSTGSSLNFGTSSVAKVDGRAITPGELQDSVRTQFEGAQAQNPKLDMAQFVAGGGFDATLDRLINERAVVAFGEDVGMRVGKRLVDGQLASVPGLQGPDGKFNQALYDGLLRQRRLTDAAVREDVAAGILAQHLTLPTGGATQMPAQLALPYASSLLERRGGQIGFVPTVAMRAGPAPTDAEVTAWYGRNVQRYSVPERRVVAFAPVTPASVKARAVPTDAEIAAAYRQDGVKYQASEKRTIAQVTVLDQAAANALAAKVRGGTSVADAARTAGLEARTLSGVAKAAYAQASSPAAADAAFAAAKGAVIGPVRGSIGFVVARVEAVEQVPGRTLTEVRGEIATALATRKTQEVMANLQDKLSTAVEDRGATLAEAARAQQLAVRTTPPLTARGTNPDQPGAKADPALAAMLQAGFAMQEGDTPTVVQTGADGSFAAVGLVRVLHAAPRPLAAVREQVVRDIAADRAKKAARQVATAIVARAKGGAALPQAFGAAGVSLPAVKPLAGQRADLARETGRTRGPLALLFTLAPGATGLLEAPNGTGWYVIRVDRVVPGDARRQPQVAAAARGELARLLGGEYVQQFTTAIRRQVGVKRDEAAVAGARRSLVRSGGTDR